MNFCIICVCNMFNLKGLFSKEINFMLVFVNLSKVLFVFFVVGIFNIWSCFLVNVVVVNEVIVWYIWGYFRSFKVFIVVDFFLFSVILFFFCNVVWILWIFWLWYLKYEGELVVFLNVILLRFNFFWDCVVFSSF